MSDPLIALRAIHEDGKLMTASESNEFLVSSQLPSMINRGENPRTMHAVYPSLRLRLTQTHPQPVDIWEEPNRPLISLSYGPFFGDHGYQTVSNTRQLFQ